MYDLIQEQFLLARHGISLTESMMLPDFEREAFVSTAVEYMRKKYETTDNLSHLVEEN